MELSTEANTSASHDSVNNDLKINFTPPRCFNFQSTRSDLCLDQKHKHKVA